MSSGQTSPQELSVHQLVLDLRPHRAWVYWLDLLVSTSVFWLGVMTLVTLPVSWLSVCLIMLISSLALYRAALFLHEIGHFSRGDLPNFEVAWNALIGWPLLLPSFLIQSHRDHHRVASFGTTNDPEYLPFAAAPRRMQAWFLLGSGLTPAFLLFRAACLVPLSWVWPSLRHWLRARASRMTMNSDYQLPLNAQRLSIWHEASEVMTTALAWGWIAAVSAGWISWKFSAAVFVCAMLANILNGWRTLHAHAYTSVGRTTDFLGQLEDSTTFKLPAYLGELVAPVGQRFHAAHHLFPYLPYHALAEADRRIRQSEWTGKAIYLQTLR